MGLQRGLATRLWRADARLRNRRFGTALRADADAPVVVLSPHCDDAVLSCWSVLTAPGDVVVVNVFTQVPPAGTLARWDRLAGATDSAAFMRERIEEDRRALALATREPVNLDLVDNQHRGGARPPSHAEIDRALTAQVARASVVYAPAVLGVVHPDHLLVREYALALTGVEVRLYADLPYAIEYGWPSWVTGDTPDPRLAPEVFWELTPNRHVGAPEGADVVRLDADAAARKLTAMQTYATQWPMLDRGPIGLLANPRVHAFEVFWPAR